VECFYIGKQKVVLFPKYKENGWMSAASALSHTKGEPENKVWVSSLSFLVEQLHQ